MTTAHDPTTPAPEPTRPAASTGLDPKVGGLLAYLLFGWIGGLIMFFTQKDPEVRFHGAQSVLLSIAMAVVFIGLGIVTSVLTVAFNSMALVGLVSLVYIGLYLASIALWILMCVKGYQLAHFKLPVIGDIAERWAK